MSPSEENYFARLSAVPRNCLTSQHEYNNNNNKKKKKKKKKNNNNNNFINV